MEFSENKWEYTVSRLKIKNHLPKKFSSNCITEE